MAVDDICVVRAVGRYQSQNIVNTMHFKILAQTSSELAILASLGTAWDGNIRSDWLAAHIDTYELIGLKIFRVTGAAKVPAFTNMYHSGTVTGVEVPSNVCRTITLYTASTNHRRRGRVMLSGSESGMFNTTDGALTTAAQAIVQTLADLMDVDLINGGDEFQWGIPPTDTLPFEAITKAQARLTPSAINSRRVRRYLIG